MGCFLICVKGPDGQPPIMAVIANGGPMFKHILIPTDGTELSDKAIDAGIEFAREVRARVTGFTAVPEYQIPGEAELMARRGVSPQEHERRSKRQSEETLR